MTPAQFKALIKREDKRTQPKKPKIRIPKPKTPNNTEREFMSRVAELLPGYQPSMLTQFEALTFVMPSGCKYTPDFIIWDGSAIFAVVETKGAHIHSPASLVRFKEAVSCNRHLKFYFFQKMEDGQWANESS